MQQESLLKISSDYQPACFLNTDAGQQVDLRATVVIRDLRPLQLKEHGGERSTMLNALGSSKFRVRVQLMGTLQYDQHS